jgi:pimeloyl-ACP methyl ester carboxylesterase
MKIKFLLLIGLLVFSGQAYAQDDTLSLGLLKGHLWVAKAKKATPLVIIVAGSGPTDRNGNNPMGITTNAYQMVAKSLAEQGISSLRYDKRGVAASMAAAVSEADLRFDTYVNDLKMWIEHFAADKRFSYIVLLGHSEGALVATLAAQTGRVKGLVCVAGSGRPIDEVLNEQLASQPESIRNEIKTNLELLKKGGTIENPNPMLMALFRPSVQPYMRSWLVYDPAVELAKIKQPVLIVQGTTDLQVNVQDAEKLHAARPKSELALIPNMNHVLKQSAADRTANVATYQNGSLPLHEQLMPLLVKFVRKCKK